MASMVEEIRTFIGSVTEVDLAPEPSSRWSNQLSAM